MPIMINSEKLLIDINEQYSLSKGSKEYESALTDVMSIILDNIEEAAELSTIGAK